MTIAGKPIGRSMLIVDTAKARGMKHKDAVCLARKVRQILKGAACYRNVKVVVAPYCN